MKFSVVTALVLALGLAACNKNDSNNETPANPLDGYTKLTQSESAADATALTEAESSLEGVGLKFKLATVKIKGKAAYGFDQDVKKQYVTEKGITDSLGYDQSQAAALEQYITVATAHLAKYAPATAVVMDDGSVVTSEGLNPEQMNALENKIIRATEVLKYLRSEAAKAAQVEESTVVVDNSAAENEE